MDDRVCGILLTALSAFLIEFAANETSVGLDYRILVIPSQAAAMTVITTNEASYFSDDKPNLDNVDVRVRSLTVGTVYRGNSGPNGTIVFEDLYEDFYELTAQKAYHSTFRKKIYLTAPGQTYEAFLQYEAVSYVFSVVPIPVTDTYEIVVETTFKTRKFNWCHLMLRSQDSNSLNVSFYRGAKANCYMGPSLFGLECN